ncbi:carbohydrate ABC transporter permease [Marinitenerispora sediminis]|uniref:Sugar ABC transporter permease n=1 Tax=Marinitenerispora sediminis TaxID=1931232 RepID=A0A368T7T2_9ACTN|nr:sugar ABC transporter permease [Marinitenerispora sediminis]RCV52016.1 sugar ABC transporter permease [Marinitenerispora sediminis]RCV56927.1 sugar ABC transporter permease [Marinitenerispora sediminis]RCV60055.1 sugar ABC transporter permease [Marinitenerispora sediminis]
MTWRTWRRPRRRSAGPDGARPEPALATAPGAGGTAPARPAGAVGGSGERAAGAARPPAAPRGGRRRPATERGIERRLAFWLLAPTLGALALVVAYPVGSAVIRSLFDDPIGRDPVFVGIDNYLQALVGFDREDFWAAVGNTVFFTVVSVLLETAIGLVMALVMHRAFRGRGIVRAAVLLPWALPTAVSAVMWDWMLQPEGIVNALIGAEVVWGGSEWPAKWSIIAAEVWKTAPFVALLILAGLQTIPPHLYEAAALDGASAWRRFTSVTLPLVRPALVVAVLFRTLDALRMYDLPQILTGGANNTETLSILVVRTATGELKAGYGGALSTLTFLFVFLCAFLLIRAMGANVFAGFRAEGGR